MGAVGGGADTKVLRVMLFQGLGSSHAWWKQHSVGFRIPGVRGWWMQVQVYDNDFDDDNGETVEDGVNTTIP